MFVERVTWISIQIIAVINRSVFIFSIVLIVNFKYKPKRELIKTTLFFVFTLKNLAKRLAIIYKHRSRQIIRIR